MCFYTQPYGLPMGSPLSPLLADIFLNDVENRIVIKNEFKNYIVIWYC